MNPFAAMTDTVKLIGAGVALLILLAVAVGIFSLFGDRAKLKEIKATDTRIEKQNTASAKVSAKRDTATTKFFAAAQADATATAKEISNAPTFDDSARDDYYRVLNNALRGPQRTDLQQAPAVPAPVGLAERMGGLWRRTVSPRP